MKINFAVKIIKKIHKQIKEKLNNPTKIKKTMNCPIKYDNFISGQFFNILNNNINNMKISFKIFNN